MERHRCKLCWRRFGSGRALGGHMRSHVMNPSMYTKIDDDAHPESDTDNSGNWDNEMEMMEMEDQEVDEGLVWVQDGSIIESVSESESSRRVLTGRRSKRFRPASIMLPGFGCTTKKTSHNVQCEANKLSESGTELEQGSSISDSTVEDVAFCLMMLSRDKWNTTTSPPDEHEEEEEVRVDQHEVIDSEDDSTKPSKKRKLNSVESNKVAAAEDKYKCETCSKTFTSYQALGGHKASHNKVKTTSNPLLEPKNNPTRPLEPRIHQCPICLRVFPSGQALGGHKRSHANNAIPAEMRAPLRFGDIVLDLNFPAPADEDDDIQQL